MSDGINKLSKVNKELMSNVPPPRPSLHINIDSVKNAMGDTFRTVDFSGISLDWVRSVSLFKEKHLRLSGENPVRPAQETITVVTHFPNGEFFYLEFERKARVYDGSKFCSHYYQVDLDNEQIQALQLR